MAESATSVLAPDFAFKFDFSKSDCDQIQTERVSDKINLLLHRSYDTFYSDLARRYVHVALVAQPRTFVATDIVIAIGKL